MAAISVRTNTFQITQLPKNPHKQYDGTSHCFWASRQPLTAADAVPCHSHRLVQSVSNKPPLRFVTRTHIVFRHSSAFQTFDKTEVYAAKKKLLFAHLVDVVDPAFFDKRPIFDGRAIAYSPKDLGPGRRVSALLLLDLSLFLLLCAETRAIPAPF